MSFTFNKGQQIAIDAGIDWYNNSSDQVFQIAGNPGTGKSVVLNEIIQRLGISFDEVAPMAYIGAAAINMRMKGLTNAKTIHSWLYEVVVTPVLNSNGMPILDTYFNKPKMELSFIPKDLRGIKLIVIDEAGTVPMSMKADIESRGIKIIVAGDLDQLPPVADKPAYLYSGKVYILDEIMRQAEGSAIIYLCQRAKRGYPIHTGMYGNNVLVITEDEVTPDMYLSSEVVLCGKNVTRERITTHIREDLLHKHSIMPDVGERLICRKNNWLTEVGGINLTNGLTGIITNQVDPSKFDGKTFEMNFLPNLTNIPFNEVHVDYQYFKANHQQKQELKMSRFSVGDKFEYGYAQTVHLAQGSQWMYGMYFEEYMHPDINDAENYTALSRFSHGAIYVKNKRKYS